jgi:hypothetical protein
VCARQSRRQRFAVQTRVPASDHAHDWINSVTMPKRFYFHLVRGHERIVDPTGLDLREELLSSPAIFDAVKKVWPGTADSTEWHGWSIEVTDPDGRVVRTITLM